MSDNAADILEIYIAYDKLKVKDLAFYLQSLDHIFDIVAEDYVARFEEGRGSLRPTLDVETVHTGNSIKFKLKEGWWPSVENGGADADIVIGLPKPVGIVLIVAWLLVEGVDKYLDIQKKWLEIEKVKIEVQVAKSDMSKATGRSDGRVDTVIINNYIENKIPEVKHVVKRTIKHIINNENITQIQINGVELKGDEPASQR